MTLLILMLVLYVSTSCNLYYLILDPDDCQPNPCQNDGTCTDGLHSYTCACELGWAGTDCDISKRFLYLKIYSIF